jgi:hypothetical protein
MSKEQASTIYEKVTEMSLRKYECSDCYNKFWVDCDDTDYPNYCPFCGKETNHNEFIKSPVEDELFPAGYWVKHNYE